MSRIGDDATKLGVADPEFVRYLEERYPQDWSNGSNRLKTAKRFEGGIAFIVERHFWSPGYSGGIEMATGVDVWVPGRMAKGRGNAAVWHVFRHERHQACDDWSLMFEDINEITIDGNIVIVTAQSNRTRENKSGRRVEKFHFDLSG